MEDGELNRKLKSASRSHEDATIESFGKHPALAVEYLNAVLADSDQKELMLALRRVSQAFGGISKLARNTKLKFGYRFVEGGANVDEVYTFAMINYFYGGLILNF